MSNNVADDFPVPKFIEGGCLCGALRYRVDFPANHDFKANGGTCQCTQCRKQTSGLFLICHSVLADNFRFTSSTSTLKIFAASTAATRGFCGDCGSLLFWKSAAGRDIEFTIGTVDALYLMGEGAAAVDGVDPRGYGRALASGAGYHVWCRNEIPGVTDANPLVGVGSGGTRYPGDKTV